MPSRLTIDVGTANLRKGALVDAMAAQVMSRVLQVALGHLDQLIPGRVRSKG